MVGLANGGFQSRGQVNLLFSFCGLRRAKWDLYALLLSQERLLRRIFAFEAYLAAVRGYFSPLNG